MRDGSRHAAPSHRFPPLGSVEEGQTSDFIRAHADDAAAEQLDLLGVGEGAYLGFDYAARYQWHVKAGAGSRRRASVEIAASRLTAAL